MMLIVPSSKILISSKVCVRHICPRKIIKRYLTTKRLVYKEFGEPDKVLALEECDIETPVAGDKVMVQMLAAPVNPSDINTIQGKYPVKVKFPCVPGNEGVGIVKAVGEDVRGIRVNDKVIVWKLGLGTWRTMAVFKENELMVVPSDIPPGAACMLTINPPTAYRMITDFVPLRQCPGTLIQNGGNSGVGQYVTQLCKHWNIPNVSVVRDRPNLKKLKEFLQSLGATYVLTDIELKSTNIFKTRCIGKPGLALNCVGGKLSNLLRHLEHSATVVTYGGMSKQPVIIPTSSFIFKNISFRGFWLTNWKKHTTQPDHEEMMKYIISLTAEQIVKAPTHKMIKIEDYMEAIKPTKGYDVKYVFEFHKEEAAHCV